jgi:hypothetical protein
MSLDDMDLENPFGYFCDENLLAFLEEHADNVQRLKNKFRSLRKDIRMELMQWFLHRDIQKLFATADLQKLETKYSDAISGALVEYGNLMYPKKAGLCPHCGVLYGSDA